MEKQHAGFLTFVCARASEKESSVTPIETHLPPYVHHTGLPKEQEDSNVVPQCNPATLEKTLKQTALQVCVVQNKHFFLQKYL